MLIRCRGYNSGVKEYLEEGQKSGRELSRNELDERVILDGNLELTELIYKSIPDKGQDRYLTFTLAFKEDEIEHDKLIEITQEFKSFLMTAYETDEFNFYAEAHLPKIKTMEDKKSGELVDRKPHIHIVIPRKNLLTGNEMNPVGSYKQNEKYLE
ncbi:TPA: MobB relaxase/mobilization protein, partial [Klebsiella pneumoniae]